MGAMQAKSPASAARSLSRHTSSRMPTRTHDPSASGAAPWAAVSSRAANSSISTTPAMPPPKPPSDGCLGRQAAPRNRAHALRGGTAGRTPGRRTYSRLRARGSPAVPSGLAESRRGNILTVEFCCRNLGRNLLPPLWRIHNSRKTLSLPDSQGAIPVLRPS